MIRRFEPPPRTRNSALSDRMMHSIRQRVGSWIAAAEVWHRILSTAAHEDVRQAWSDGHVPPYVVDEAVAQFLREREEAEARA